MSSVVNHNHASGTFHNVYGTQHNYNFGGTVVMLGSQPAAIEAVPTNLDPSNVSLKYRDVLDNILAIRRLLCEFINQPFAPGYLLSSIDTELTKFARMVVHAAKALDIIDGIPGKLKYLRHFQDVSNFVRGFNSRLRDLCSDMLTYNSQIQLSAPPGFWRSLWLYIFTLYRWGRLASDIRLFLEDNHKLLEQFLSLLTSRDWRAIVSGSHSHQLEKLLSGVNLTSGISLYHIQMQKIVVRDHLGRRILVPLEFCTSWTDLGIIIKHYCQGVEGSEIIQRNDWELVEATDGRVVDPSKFQSIVKSDLELDVSVVLRRLISSLFTCPACDYDNPRRETADGWINCYNCDKKFRVVVAVPPPNAGPPLPAISIHSERELDDHATTAVRHRTLVRLKPLWNMIKKTSKPLRRRHQPSTPIIQANVNTSPEDEPIQPASPPIESPETPSDQISRFHRVSIRVNQASPRRPQAIPTSMELDGTGQHPLFNFRLLTWDTDTFLAPNKGMIIPGWIKPTGRVTCSVPFNTALGWELLAIGCEEGVWIGFEYNPRSLRCVLQIKGVTQCAVLETLGILLVLADGLLFAHLIDALIPSSPTSAPVSRVPQRLNGTGRVQFFRVGKVRGRTLVIYMKKQGRNSIFRVLEPIVKNMNEPEEAPANIGSRSTKSNWLHFRTYKDLLLPSETFDLSFLKTQIAICSPKGFDIVDPADFKSMTIPQRDDPRMESLMKRCKSSRPLGILRCTDAEYLLVYNEFGFHVNRNGARSRDGGPIEWKGSAQRVAFHLYHILLFNPRFIEIRHAETGKLTQIIPNDDIWSIDGQNMNPHLSAAQASRVYCAFNDPEASSPGSGPSAFTAQHIGYLSIAR